MATISSAVAAWIPPCGSDRFEEPAGPNSPARTDPVARAPHEIRRGVGVLVEGLEADGVTIESRVAALDLRLVDRDRSRHPVGTWHGVLLRKDVTDTPPACQPPEHRDTNHHVAALARHGRRPAPPPGQETCRARAVPSRRRPTGRG